MTDAVTSPPDAAALKVLDGLEIKGMVNVPDDILLAHVASSIRRGHPQMRPFPTRPERIVLVGSGPSLNDTEDELVQLVHEGALLVTMNGAYHWCLERNLRPQTQILVDARASNARFVVPVVPRCQYVLASQVHPDVWEAVDGRDNVWIFHAVNEPGAVKDELDRYYLKQWAPVVGGTTVATRAIALLRMCGWLRFDLFGCDSCFIGDQHHAFPQAENDRDRRYRVRVHPSGAPELAREFVCAPWHLKQLECFLQLVKFSGHQFLLNVHGDGLLAYALQSQSEVIVTEET